MLCKKSGKWEMIGPIGMESNVLISNASEIAQWKGNTVNFGISEPEGTGKIGSDKPKFVTTEVSGYPSFIEF